VVVASADSAVAVEVLVVEEQAEVGN